MKLGIAFKFALILTAALAGIFLLHLVFSIKKGWFAAESSFLLLILPKNIGQIISDPVFLMAFFCLLIVALIFFLIIWLIILPLKKIKAATDFFNEGNLNSEIKIKAKDEIGDLADSLNMMFRDLKKSKFEMEWYAKNLEVKIKARTNALEMKNAEQEKINEKLEHANKLMVGRELRMIELKKEIEKLKKADKDNK
jgi:HAMP domain-containing protein/uncharacterized coiled-coil protein SlyX